MCHVAVYALLNLAMVGGALGQTLEDFGYRHMKRNGVLALGGHPLLLVIVSFDGESDLLHDVAYYEDIVFDRSGANNSLNGYVEENSNGSFWWTPAASDSVYLSLSSDETLDAFESHMVANGLTNTTYSNHWFEVSWFSNIIYKVMEDTIYDFEFADFDEDESGTVKYGELPVLVLSNDSGSPGLGRWPPSVEDPDMGIYVQTMGVGAMEQNGNEMGFNVFCHEATHMLGCTDLYGPHECFLGESLSLYCDMIDLNRVHDIFHVDPWHKLQLGWIEPQIQRMDTHGSATLYPPQSARRDAALLLHNPARGTEEFFLVEYRANDTGYGSGYDTNVADNGVVIWHVWHDENTNEADMVACDCSEKMCPSVFTEGAPDLNYGGNTVWTNGQKTPHFSWIDPAVEPRTIPSRLTVSSFSPGDNSVQVTWEGTTLAWVDFGYIGTELGTFDYPHNTLAEGVVSVPVGDTIMIKSGTSSETPLITKALRIESYGGSATIGR